MSYYTEQRQRLRPVVMDALAKAREKFPDYQNDAAAQKEARREIGQYVADIMRELNRG